MKLDVTIQEHDNDQELVIGSIGLKAYMIRWLTHLKNLNSLVKEYGVGTWLANATRQARIELDSDLKQGIKRAEDEIAKARIFVRNNYRNERRRAFVIFLITYPFQPFFKWLQK